MSHQCICSLLLLRQSIAPGLCLVLWLHVLCTLVCLSVVMPNSDGSSAVFEEKLIRNSVYGVRRDHTCACQSHSYLSLTCFGSMICNMDIERFSVSHLKPDRQAMLKLQCCVLFVIRFNSICLCPGGQLGPNGQEKSVQ